MAKKQVKATRARKPPKKKVEVVPASEFVVDTKTALQRFFGKSHQTIKEWANQGMPVRKDGRYDLKAVFDWWLSSEKFKRTVGATTTTDVELEKQKLAIDVEHRRLKYLRDAGDLVMRDRAMSAIEHMFHQVRTRLLAIPEELGSSLPSETRASYIVDAKHKVSLALREMEGWSFEREVGGNLRGNDDGE